MGRHLRQEAETSPRPPLPLPVRLRLMAASLCCEKTCAKWWRGEPVFASTSERLARAAREIGLELPPDLRRAG